MTLCQLLLHMVMHPQCMVQRAESTSSRSLYSRAESHGPMLYRSRLDWVQMVTFIPELALSLQLQVWLWLALRRSAIEIGSMKAEFEWLYPMPRGEHHIWSQPRKANAFSVLLEYITSTAMFQAQIIPVHICHVATSQVG